MPVFPDSNFYYKGRSHSQLVVSEGNAPAEKYLPAATEGTKFQYEFGPENNKNVVIPKGKIVAFNGMRLDPETEKYVPALSIANGSLLPAGVNHHNVYELKRDKFSGSSPTVLTREYIRVPLFVAAGGTTAKDAANAIKFGAAWYDGADPADIYGKYVKADSNGNFTVSTDPAADVAQIVGQVFGVEKDMPPAGFLQYFLEMTDNEYTQFIKDTQIVPSPGRATSKLGSLDIATFPTGSGYYNTRDSLALALKSFQAGIPFLTDGYFKARTNKTYSGVSDTGVTAFSDIKVMGQVAVNASTMAVTVTDPQGSAIFLRIPDTFAKDLMNSGDAIANYYELGGLQSTIVVTTRLVAGPNTVTQVPASNIHIDFQNNLVVVYFTSTMAASTIHITATVLENQIPGIPTGWDFKGCMGEARILLKK